MVRAGRPVGRRRPLVEAPRGRALAAPQRLLEHVALAPALEHALLELGERRAWIDGAMAWARDSRNPRPRRSPRCRSARRRDRDGLRLVQLLEDRRGGVEARDHQVARGDRHLAEAADRARRRCPAPHCDSRTRSPAGRRCEPRRRAVRSCRASCGSRSAPPRRASARGARGRGGSAPRRASASNVRMPARRRISSSACACRASRLAGAEASKIIAASVRVAGGVSRLIAASQPVAWRHANSYSGVGRSVLSALVSSAMLVSNSSSTVRSTERSVRLSSSRRFARSSSNALNAAVSRPDDDGPSPRSRASEIADDTLCVSASV